MAYKTTASGKMDKRTKEYKELCERLAKGRKKAARTVGGVQRTKSGGVDKRTKEGKAIAARMAKARAARGSFTNRLKRLFR